MAEPIDIYSDSFQLNTSPYGSTLNFMLSPSTPPAPGKIPQSETLASVRMSLEHLKVMTFVLRREIMNHEQRAGVTIQIPTPVLNSLGISIDDWNSLWKL
ncbi:MAG TPA: hypothetical protein VEG43_05480 [Dehalococcoidia bacterium]|nr:hypothetical protein [Dehalococcoidia bacterium]